MAATQQDYDWFESRITGRRVAEDTAAKYKRWVKRFEQWRGNRPPDLSTLIEFDTKLRDEGWTDYPWENVTGRRIPDEYSYSSRRVALSAAKLWLRLNYDEEISEEVQNIVSGEPAPFDPPYLSMGDVERVIEDARDACDCDGCQAALALTYDAILRGAELTAVQRGDIDFDAGTLDVRSVKGSNRVTLSLAPQTLRYVERYVEQYDPQTAVFTNTYGNGWKPDSFTSHFQNQHHEVGAHAFGRHSPIMHRLNHAEEFHDMDETGDVFGQVFRRARHANPSMTTRYARMVGADIPDWGEN